MEEVDSALLPGNPDDYADFLTAKAAIQSVARISRLRGHLEISTIPGLGSENPVVAIRRLLEGCPDEAVYWFAITIAVVVAVE